MYAVIATGGKQYRVAEGDVIQVEKLPASQGEVIELDQVMMVGSGDDVTIGTPFVDGCKVTAEVMDQRRAKKIEVIKFKRRKHHRKQMGHRQSFTELEIKQISR